MSNQFDYFILACECALILSTLNIDINKFFHNDIPELDCDNESISVYIQ